MFKTGDRVRVKTTVGDGSLVSVGDTGEITEIFPDKCAVEITSSKREHGSDTWLMPHESLELIPNIGKSATIEAMPLRLEIATRLYAGYLASGSDSNYFISDALTDADAFIKAHKETKGE